MKKLNRELFNIVKRKPVYITMIILLNLLVTGYIWGLLQKRDSGIKMNHKLHVVDNSVECKTCHPIDSSNTRFMTFQGHKVCSECHEKVNSKNKSDCLFCHTNSDNTTSLRKNVQLSPLVNFDHKKHEDKGIKCLSCHVNANSNVKVSGNSMLPEMELCVSCHKEKKVAKTGDCTTCHVKGYERIRPVDHTAWWVKRHGKDLDSEVIRSSCKTCHTRQNGNDCLDCHRKEAPTSHNIAWRIRSHAQRAQIDRKSCSTCHNQSECTSCHQSTEPISHTGFWGAPYNRHCMNCHVEGGDFSSTANNVGRNCTFCHQYGSIRGRHTILPRPSGHPTTGCSNNSSACHNGKLGLRHPYPASTLSCKSCHR